MRREDGSFDDLRRSLSIASDLALTNSLIISIMAIDLCRLEQHGQVMRIPVVGFETHVARKESRADINDIRVSLVKGSVGVRC